jgi:glycosyltransferase involved in cell wall biosynthesis
MEQFALSVILPVVDETESLRETVRLLLADNSADIAELLLIVCKLTTPESLKVCEEISELKPGLARIYWQKRPYLGGAVRDAFEWAGGTHILLMASDLETDPTTVKFLIAAAKDNYDIATASRWNGHRAAFQGYDPLKYCLNWIFQLFIKLLYQTSLSDATYGFRIFKAPLVKGIVWEELRHPFLLETILKPLRLGATVVEVPTTWRARSEGASHNTFLQNFVYFRTAIKVRLESKHRFEKPV